MATKTSKLKTMKLFKYAGFPKKNTQTKMIEINLILLLSSETRSFFFLRINFFIDT